MARLLLYLSIYLSNIYNSLNTDKNRYNHSLIIKLSIFSHLYKSIFLLYFYVSFLARQHKLHKDIYLLQKYLQICKNKLILPFFSPYLEILNAVINDKKYEPFF